MSARVRVVLATVADAAAIASIHNAAADDLTARFGKGTWSTHGTDHGVRFAMSRGRIYIARAGRTIVGSMTLGTRKPWAIDPSYFTNVARPLYLTGMAVQPSRQGAGIGRALIDESRRIAGDWPADAIRLDAFDGEVGAGAFYAKCGFREVGRRTYRTAPLVYFEWLPALK